MEKIIHKEKMKGEMDSGPSKDRSKIHGILCLMGIWFGVVSCVSNQAQLAVKPIKTFGSTQEMVSLTPNRGFVSFNIPPDSEIEVFEMSWPSDDRLCDTYEGSDGGLVYRVYRLKESKKIMYVNQEGYFCQGDSEYYQGYYFNENGNLIYSVQGGIYQPIIARFYTPGQPTIEVNYAGEGENSRKRVISPLPATTQITTGDITQQIQNFREKMRKRMEALQALSVKLKEKEDQQEADSLINLLQISLEKEMTYTDGYVWRKPRPIKTGVIGEVGRLTGTDIRVRKTPHLNAEVIAKASEYELWVSVIEIGKTQTIAPYGEHAWYKISYLEDYTQQKIEGWVFGAFVMEGVYKK
jgi:hypothetical protein